MKRTKHCLIKSEIGKCEHCYNGECLAEDFIRKICKENKTMKKQHKVGDRIFFEYLDSNEIGSATIKDIEDRSYIDDFGKERHYKLYSTSPYEAIEDYNCLPEDDPRVVAYKGKELISPSFEADLREWLEEHGARKGDKEVENILYQLYLDFSR